MDHPKLSQVGPDYSQALCSRLFPDLATSVHPVDVYAIMVDEETIGYIGHQLLDLKDDRLAAPHIHIFKSCRTPKRLIKAIWLINNVYLPMMKARGYARLVATCAPDDTGMKKLMGACGGSLREVTIATFLL